MRFRRRRYLISKLQLRLLLILGIHGFTAVLGIAGLVFLPLALDMNDAGLSESERAKASAAFLSMDMRLWPAFATILIAIGTHAVLITHRIVGPLYRLTQVMGAAARGDHTIVAHIRDRDYLHAETEVLNDLLRSVRQKWVDVQGEAIRLREILDRSADAPDSGVSVEPLRELSEILDRLEGHLEARTGTPSEIDSPADPPEPSSALPATRQSDCPLDLRSQR